MPEESGEFFIEMSGQSSSSSSTAEPASKDALPASSASETAKPLELRATYSSFSQRVPSTGKQSGPGRDAGEVRGRAACGDDAASEDGEREAAADRHQLTLLSRPLHASGERGI